MILRISGEKLEGEFGVEVAKKEMEKMDDKWVVNVYNELAEDQGNAYL